MQCNCTVFNDNQVVKPSKPTLEGINVVPTHKCCGKIRSWVGEIPIAQFENLGEKRPDYRQK